VSSIVRLLLAALLPVTGLVAQTAPTRSGTRPLLPRATEILLARSAAPASVSAQASVMVFTDTGFVLAQTGSNGVTCIVNRSWPASLEPHCYDEEGSRTILPIEMRRTLLYHQGRSEAEVDADVGHALAIGTLRLPQRPAVTYMMSAGQQLVGDDGKPAGNWRPHVMVYYPYLTNRAAGFAATPDMAVGMVADEGGPLTSLMFVMPQFVKVGSHDH
jgi:hypothetical protein